MTMFCYQCQETAKNEGCTVRGVCGKQPDVADLQDLLVFILKGISYRAIDLRKSGRKVEPKVNHFIIESLFMTITNANFDKERFVTRIKEAIALRDSIPAGEEKCPNCDCQTWKTDTVEEMEAKALTVGVLHTVNDDIRSLRELLTYGIKGMAAYAEHAEKLGFEDESIYDFIQEGLVATTQELGVEDMLKWVLKCGEFGVKTMALLDKANTSTYGSPEITKVNIGVRNNPGILISGHDLRDLYDLLEQTKDSGVDVYTHCEMLPTHYYPAFKKYTNLVGNYGNSWWKQKEEFTSFNGPILFTTNCLVPPLPNATYADKVYTTGVVGFEGFKHIANREEGKMKDFSAIIEHAKKCTPPTEIETGEIVGGFAHAQVVALADKVVDAVKAGAIKKFFVMAGCDGRMLSRKYYTEFAEALPKDTIILTAGCAKFRYNKLPLGNIGGIPRVLDAGQCNDSYSLVMIALKLKEAFGLASVNDLPIAYNIAWYEQKAVIVFLALLSLGVKNIHLGPTLPAFLSPDVVDVLVDKFGVAGITDVDSDMKILLGK